MFSRQLDALLSEGERLYSSIQSIGKKIFEVFLCGTATARTTD